MNDSVLWIIISVVGIVIFIVAIWLNSVWFERHVKALETQYSENKKIVDALTDYNNLLEAYSYERFVEQMQQVEKNYKVYDYIGNELFDSVLSYKKKQADSMGIDVRVECRKDEVSYSWPMSETDTVALMFNLMDNSIEAAGKCKVPFILIEIESGKGIRLTVENSKPDDITTDDLLVTTKDNRIAHGFGVEVINQLAVKYEGNAAFEDKGDTFAVIIDIPI